MESMHAPLGQHRHRTLLMRLRRFPIRRRQGKGTGAALAGEPAAASEEGRAGGLLANAKNLGESNRSGRRYLVRQASLLAEGLRRVERGEVIQPPFGCDLRGDHMRGAIFRLFQRANKHWYPLFHEYPSQLQSIIVRQIICPRTRRSSLGLRSASRHGNHHSPECRGCCRP
jgi:hypothetical protein